MIDENMVTSGGTKGKIKLVNKDKKIIERSHEDYLNNIAHWEFRGYKPYFEEAKVVKEEVKEVKAVKKTVKKVVKKEVEKDSE